MSSTKFDPNPMTLVRVINRFQLKERKSTFESPADTKSTYIPLSRYQIAIPLRLSSYSQGSITTHSPCPHPNFILIHHHSSELHTFLCSPQKHEFFDPHRLSSFSQGSTSTHSPCTPPNLIQIQRHTPELHSTPTQRALIYL